MENIQNGEIDLLDRAFKEEKNRKLVKHALVLERCAVTALVNSYIDKKTWRVCQVNLKNIF